MASFYSVTPLSAVVITPVASGVTYQQLVNDLGNTRYVVGGLYLQSAFLTQLQQPISFTYINSDGESRTIPVVPVKNFFTSGNIPVLYLDLSGYDIIFDANLFMDFNLLPYADLTMVFDVQKYSLAMALRSMMKFACAEKVELPDIDTPIVKADVPAIPSPVIQEPVIGIPLRPEAGIDVPDTTPIVVADVPAMPSPIRNLPIMNIPVQSQPSYDGPVENPEPVSPAPGSGSGGSSSILPEPQPEDINLGDSDFLSSQTFDSKWG